MNSLSNQKKDILIWGLLIVGFLISRLVNITKIPIFTDEAIYLWWAKIGLLDNSQRFISLTDGKQPLLIWLFTLAMRYIQDPLLAGRIVSVLCGLTGMIGMFFLGRELFKNKFIGYSASFLYCVSPFFLLHDRLALYDSLVTSFTIWSLYCIILLVRLVRLDVALILAWVFGGGLLTKSNAFLNIFYLPGSLILVTKRSFFSDKFFRWLFYSILATGIAILMYNLLRLSPWFYIIARKNEEFVYPLREWIRHPIQYFLPNLDGLFQWLVIYLSLPIIAVVLVGSVLGREFLRERIFLLGVFLFPFLSLSFFGKVLFPRYLLPMVVPLYILCSYTLYKFWNIKSLASIFKVAIVATVLIQPVFISFNLLFRPVAAQIPKTDRDQYFDEWPSGYGVPEVISFIRQVSKNQKIYLATEGTFGLFPAAFELYFVQNPNVETHGYWPVNDDTMKELVKIARHKPTYLVFKETNTISPQWPLKKIFEIPRGRGKTSLRFFQVMTPSE